MKKLVTALLAASLLAGCTSSTQYGRCIGVNDNENPKLEYDVSAWNAFLGVIFVETIIVPLVVIFDKAKCPVGPKEQF